MANTTCDVLVIGGGHAGAEAAWAAANLGARTILVTHDRRAIGRMSCNPAIGGIGKGQIVREIDALGGLMGLVTDEVGIQFRMLNRGKGPAVWAPRAQADSSDYTAVLLRYLENCPNLTIVDAGAAEITSRETAGPGAKKAVTGVILENGDTIRTTAIVVAAGTFLRGLMHTGEQQTPGGRINEPAAERLSDSLRSLGLDLQRLKTGTPPRVARDSIDYARLREQPGDSEPAPFSFLTRELNRSQVSCWLTTTNPEIHDLIRANLDRAPLYTGQIASTGPRYCPSIETKIIRFPDKLQHQVFLEPEGRDSERIYVNGISTSLPRDVQQRMVQLIPGLERARIIQWGYAIEYDFVPPEQIDATLMAKAVSGLFLAGQINGTSGYEEAGGLGLLAGVNATNFAAEKIPLILGRDQAYIGVMVDDLVTRGVTEPYRMFTSRAEHRMHLRYDNADTRLTPLGRQIGLISDQRWAHYTNQQQQLEALLAVLAGSRWEGRALVEWLKRPEEDGSRFRATLPELAAHAAADVWQRALVLIKYDGYIKRQQRAIERFRKLEDQQIPLGTDFAGIPHLRREAAECWSHVQPRNLGQAARVSGIHPTDVTTLLVYLSGAERG